MMHGTRWQRVPTHSVWYFIRLAQGMLKSLELAADIARAAGPFVTVVGLFVDQASEYLNRVLAAVPWIFCGFTVMKAPNF
ncbi:MAG: hypothetical protein U5M23_15420 [Marinagarivorans sp.]|nr:hypothetical protein [Marinagarivorans sp.]